MGKKAWFDGWLNQVGVIGSLLLLLAACQPANPALPALLPTAEVPTVTPTSPTPRTPTPARPVPPTFTPGVRPTITAPPPLPTFPPANSGGGVLPPAGLTSYVVGAGDTLLGIANAFGVSLADLIALNKITDQDHIEVGQVLIIPNR